MLVEETYIYILQIFLFLVSKVLIIAKVLRVKIISTNCVHFLPPVLSPYVFWFIDHINRINVSSYLEGFLLMLFRRGSS
jgi:hypothetical protein